MVERGKETLRTYKEINEKIQRGDVVVMTADEFVEYAKTYGVGAATKEVDVVTTGTFGAMCSSGVFLNFGHSDPPIKMYKCWLNDVPAYGSIAAVDVYLGATALSETKGLEYGGGHVIEDLVSGKEVELKSEGFVTDCYPRRYVETTITLDDLNQAILLNPRNASQRYNAATNTTDHILYTYMGTLLPHMGNVTFSGSGQLSPLYKDKNFEVIGIGTRIFLGGGIGYVVGEGTQHNPQNQLGTLMVRGDLKQMNPKYLKGATFHKYGVTLYVGVGIPIPIINLKVAETAAIPDEEIFTDVLDYGVPSIKRPSLGKVSYAELKSGKVVLNDKSVPSSPLSSLKQAKAIAETLKRWIEEGKFYVSKPVELLPFYREFKPLKIRRFEPKVKDIITVKAITAKPSDEVKFVASLIVEHNIDHVPIVDDEGKLVGIVTSWDIAKAVAQNKKTLREVMTTKVVTANQNEFVDVVAKRLSDYRISGAPVIDDERKVVGVITTDDIAKLLGGRKP